MGGRTKLTLDAFKQRATEVHSGKYTYLNAVWAGSQEFITITCQKHGDFSQKASPHLRGKGCKSCAVTEVNARRRPEVSVTIKKLKELHKSLSFPNPHSVYTRTIDFVCQKHGLGSMKLGSLLNGIGCKKCAADNRGKQQRSTTEQFIEKAKSLYQNEPYSYHKVLYVTAIRKITITCSVHGDFSTTPNNFLNGRKCPSCSRSKQKVSISRKVFSLDSKAEDTALKHLLRVLKVKASEVFDQSSGKVPTIVGSFEGFKRYLPDFYVPKKNLVLEVKDPCSFGINNRPFYNENPEILIKRMQKKAIRTVELGYKFKLLVVDGAEILPIPKNWEYYKPKDLIYLFNKRP